MANGAKVTQYFRCKKISPFTFACFWLVGFLVGCFYAYISQSHFLSLMLRSVQAPLSIVSRFVCTCFLFLFVFLFANRHRLEGLVLICFIKAFSYGFNLMLLTLLFQSSAWLVYRLFLFSDTFICVTFLWSCMRCSIAEGLNVQTKIGICIVLCFAVTLIDFAYIVPFVRGLF